MAQKVYSVKEINTYIKDKFDSDRTLLNISVMGEVSNCRPNQRKHIFFTLKDESGTISCVMFEGNRGGLSFALGDGQQVVVHGYITVYPRDGKYQLYADFITQAGAGAQSERLKALKRELGEMGMFDPQYKKPIPAYARKVGVVTAAGGAAVKDIMRVAHDRNPYVQLILYPAQVQGQGAAASVARGISMFSQLDVDVIIIGRGGGSAEDLEAFDSEVVAYAIFNSPVPVISAVGHEINDSIADMVADLRVPTPTAAATAAVYDYHQLQTQLDDRQTVLKNLMDQALTVKRLQLKNCESRLRLLHPGNRIENYRKQAEDLEKKLRDDMQKALKDARDRQQSDAGRLKERHPAKLINDDRMRTAQAEETLRACMEKRMTREQNRFNLCLEKLKALSPLQKLSQGYSYVQQSDGKALKSITQVKNEDPLKIYVTDGVVDASVTGTKEEEYGGRKQDGRE